MGEVATTTGFREFKNKIKIINTSTEAFVVVKVSSGTDSVEGDAVVTVDTTNGQLILGTGVTISGAEFVNGTVFQGTTTFENININQNLNAVCNADAVVCNNNEIVFV